MYVSNRGHNTIAIFEISKEGDHLKLIFNESVKGEGPRNFKLSPDEKFLIVANQLTNNLVSFKRDEKTGLLHFTHQIESFTPVCILF